MGRLPHIRKEFSWQSPRDQRPLFVIPWQGVVLLGTTDLDHRHPLDVETARLTPPGTAFHPKSWLFEGPGVAVGFVGSSNISRSALAGGIEWNLRTDRALAPEAWTRLTAAFDALWTAATPLTAAWLADYESRTPEILAAAAFIQRPRPTTSAPSVENAKPRLAAWGGRRWPRRTDFDSGHLDEPTSVRG